MANSLLFYSHSKLIAILFLINTAPIYNQYGPGGKNIGIDLYPAVTFDVPVKSIEVQNICQKNID